MRELLEITCKFDQLRDPVDGSEAVVWLERVETRRTEAHWADISTPVSLVYRLPDGWDVERVRDLLREHGFERTDNRQDDLNDPHAFD